MRPFFELLHHGAMATLLCCALLTIAQWHRPFDLATARRLRRLDAINGLAATLVLVVGLVRVLYLEKGADYYWHNAPFQLKLALYGMASALSVAPTWAFARWRTPLLEGRLPPTTPQQHSRLRAVAYAQLLCLLAMGWCARGAARGLDWAWWS